MARKILTQALHGLTSPVANLAHPLTGVAAGTVNAAMAATGAYGTYLSADMGLTTGVYCLRVSATGGYSATGWVNMGVVNGAGHVDVYGSYAEAEAAGTLLALPSAGTGPWALAVTVTDGTDPLPGATVTATAGGSVYSATANGSGVATFYLGNGTYTLAAAATGHYNASGSATVLGAAQTATIALTAVGVVVTPTGTVAGYWLVLDEAGEAEEAAQITMALVQAPVGTGVAYDRLARTVTTEADGLATFAGLVPGATYSVQRGSGPVHRIAVAANATSPVALGNIIGEEVAA